LRAQRVAEFLIGDDLQHGIVTLAVAVVGIFVASNNLIDALRQQRQRVVAYTVVMPRIAEASGHLVGQMMALIEGSQRAQNPSTSANA